MNLDYIFFSKLIYRFLIWKILENDFDGNFNFRKHTMHRNEKINKIQLPNEQSQYLVIYVCTKMFARYSSHLQWHVWLLSLPVTYVVQRTIIMVASHKVQCTIISGSKFMRYKFYYFIRYTLYKIKFMAYLIQSNSILQSVNYKCKYILLKVCQTDKKC